MDRAIVFHAEQLRGYDFVSFETDAMIGLARAMLSILGQTTTVIDGATATATGPASLTINLTAGRICQFADTDTTAIGLIPQNLANIMQQGYLGASTVTLSTSGITGGHSRYTLIQAQFNQVDDVPPDDPNGGNVPFYNAADPTSPIINSIDTERAGVLTIGTKNGTNATTGSEVPPTPDAGWIPLYLVDLAFGQTAINNGDILVAGPSVGTNVPNNYPFAPFLAGLLNSHHGGTPGQAPKINLANEVQGILPATQVQGGRIPLGGTLDLYVNGSTGSNSNDGLTVGNPFLTLQKAWNLVMADYDLNDHQVTIHQAGTNTDQLLATGSPVGAQAATPITIDVQGTWSVVNKSCVIANSTQVAITGTGTLAATGGGLAQGAAILALNAAVVTFSGISFGTCAQGHIIATQGGVVAAGGNYKITNNAPYHVVLSYGASAQISFLTLTLTGTPAFSGAFAFVDSCSSLNAIGDVFTGSATGTRYSATNNGVIATSGGGGSYLPGNAAGSVATGGQYN